MMMMMNAAQAMIVLLPYGPMDSPPAVECHDSETRSGGLNLVGLEPKWSEPETFAKWARVYDRIPRGEMPPRDHEQPPLAIA